MLFNIIILVSLAVLVVISTIISTLGTLINKEEKGIKHFTKLFWWLIFINIIIIALMVLQYVRNETEKTRKEQENNKNQHQRDSINKADNNAYSQKTISAISDGLGKYGFKFDSTNKVLVKIIKDSAKTKVIMPNDPVLECSSIEFIKKNGDWSEFYLFFTSYDACSTGFKITSTFVISTSDKIYASDDIVDTKYACLGDDQEPLSYNDKMSKDETKGVPFRVKIDNSIEKIYIRLKGTYTNCDLSKSFPIDNIYFYKVKNKYSGFVPLGKTTTKIIEAIESYHKKNESP